MLDDNISKEFCGIEQLLMNTTHTHSVLNCTPMYYLTIGCKRFYTFNQKLKQNEEMHGNLPIKDSIKYLMKITITSNYWMILKFCSKIEGEIDKVPKNSDYMVIKLGTKCFDNYATLNKRSNFH